MSRTLQTILRGAVGVLLLGGASVAACRKPAPEPIRPLGESSAPLPTNAAAPLGDAPGVPDPSSPTPPVTPPTGALREGHATTIALVYDDSEEYAADAGLPPRGPGLDAGSGSNLPRPTNPPNAPRPTNPGNGSGSGGNPLPAPGSPATPPRVPSPTQPGPGSGRATLDGNVSAR